MQVIFFNKKAEKFFLSLEAILKSKAEGIIQLLKRQGHNLEMPFSKALGKGLFELRIIDIVHVRFIYVFHVDCAWILHGFVKKTSKIPKRELDYAQKQLKMLLHWYNG